MQLHEVFQPGLKLASCNRKRLFKKICSGSRAEISARLRGLKNSPCNRPLRNPTTNTLVPDILHFINTSKIEKAIKIGHHTQPVYTYTVLIGFLCAL